MPRKKKAVQCVPVSTIQLRPEGVIRVKVEPEMEIPIEIEIEMVNVDVIKGKTK